MKSGLKKITLLTLAVFLALTACQPVDSAIPTGTGKPATVTPRVTKPAATPSATPQPSLGIDAALLKGTQVEVWHAFFGPAADVFEAQAIQFSVSNEWGIQIVTRSLRGSYPLLFDQVTAALEDGNQPDMVIGLPEYITAWDALDLAPYLHDVDYGMSADELADIPSVFLAQEQMDGQQLGMPAQRSARLLLYNVSWANELGFDAAPVTADEFREQACAGNAAFRQDEDLQNDGYGGWLVDSDALTALGWMFAFEGEVTGDDGYEFNTADNRAALSFVKELYDDNCAWLATGSTQFESFVGRRALFATANLSEFEEVKAAFKFASNLDEWTVLAFPGLENTSFALSGTSFIVLESSDVKQLASWLFVRWLLSPDSQSRWARNTGMFPLRTSTLDELSAFKTDNPQWAAATELIPFGHIQPQLASWRKVRVMMGDSFAYLFRFNLPVADVPDLLAEMDATAADLNK